MSLRVKSSQFKKEINKIMNERMNETNELSMEEIHEQQDNEILQNKNIVNFQQNIYNSLNQHFSFVFDKIKILFHISKIYLLWILLHFIASQLYIKLCVPSTLWGFLISPFIVATPYCQGLRWVVYNAANIINNMWVVLGTWICSTILIIDNYKSSSEET
jgi:hypothetical protein